MGKYFQEAEIKPTEMDGLLKEMVVKVWTEAIEYQIKSDHVKCFKAYKTLYHLIDGYDYSFKTKLGEEIRMCLIKYILFSDWAESLKIGTVDKGQTQIHNLPFSDNVRFFSEYGNYLQDKETQND